MIKIAELCTLYLENDYPSDRLVQDQAALAAFTREYNRRTGGGISERDLADLLVSTRKRGHLPGVGRNWRGPTIQSNDCD